MNVLIKVYRRARTLLNGNPCTAASVASIGNRPPSRRFGARLRDGCEGQALAEFALVLPFLMFVLTAVYWFSMAMYSKMALQTATDQGVQMLALSQNISPTNPCVAATTTIQTATSLNSSLIGITFYNGSATGTAISGTSCAGLASKTTVTVVTTYPCTFAAIYTHLPGVSSLGSCQLSVSESEAVP
jgi:Flp pilus assembly protein TadG